MTALIFDLATLTASDGYIVDGDATGDQAGFRISNVGDVNGDGIDDFIIGALNGDDGGTNAGEAYVIFGRAGATRANIDLTSLAPADGFIIVGDTGGDSAGFNVHGLGDINNDGIDDFVVGATNGDDGGANAGEAYVIFGRLGAARANIDLTTLSAADGFIIQGDASGDAAGRVSAAGDVNGDGIDDILVGAATGDDGGINAGEAYVVFGKSGTFGSNVSGRQVLDLTTLSAAEGFIIQGDADSDQAGFAISDAGDVNGDGIADLIVGATFGDDGGVDAGEAYIIFGRTTGFGSDVAGRRVIDLAALTASDGFLVIGDTDGDRAGYSVSTAGDLNGDGIDDLIIGAVNGDDAGANAGEAYVIFGKVGATRATIDLTSLSASDGFILQGVAAGNSTGNNVSNAGDINGDGFEDVIVGARLGDRGGTNAGEAYVIFGHSGGFGSDVGGRQVVDLAALSAGDGIVILGDAVGSSAGFAVSAAGDVNDDGLADIIVGAPSVGAGQTYVIYGSSDFGVIRGTGANDVLTGNAGRNTMVGGLGDDVIVGGANADTMSGGAGNDIYVVDNAGDVVTENAGEGTRDSVETDLATYILPANVENLEYFGAGAFTGTGNAEANTMVAGSLDDVLNGGDGDDTLGGEAGNDTLNGGNGADRLNGGTGADTMNGQAGNDRMIVDNAGDVANGGDGIDTVEISAPLNGYTVAADVEIVRNISGGDVRVTLNALANTYGGSNGFDFVQAGAGNDSIYGRGGGDDLSGQDGNDYLFGEAGDDILNGNDGADLLYGGTDTDALYGGAGSDTLYGEAGLDFLDGGAGRDTLFGGAGADSFYFNTGETGTTIATADRIGDFSQAQGDTLAFQGLPEVFSAFLGTAAFTGSAGQVRYEQIGGNTYVSIDLDGDAAADAMVRLDGWGPAPFNDFVWADSDGWAGGGAHPGPAATQPRA